jgi:hypothetical protein
MSGEVMDTRSGSLTSRLRILPTVFAVAALPVIAIHLSPDPASSTRASNGTITIGTRPPDALPGVTDRLNPAVPHTPIIKG